MAILPIQLARVSNLLRANLASSTIARTQQKLLAAQNELSTGQRISAPSDDPGDAAVAMQLQKLLEQRQAYADNLKHAQSQLGEVDSTLGDVTDLLQQAQQIASANVGSDVTPDQRAGAAEVVKSLYSQMLSLANKQFEGVFLFAGDRSTEPPFVEEGGGVKFVGTSNLLKNVYDENTSLAFMVDGAQVFGALSTRVRGSTDLSPALSASTRLTDLAGAGAEGVRLGSIQLGNGTDAAIVDLSGADSMQDVINAINNAGVGSITAAIAAGGDSLVLSGGAGDDITVNEIGGGTTAADLGILRTSAQGAGVGLNGASVGAKVTLLTPLADLRNGAGIDTSGLTLSNGQTNATVDLSGAVTVEDLINAVNASDAGVLARINDAGTGLDLVNPIQGLAMTVGENGGTTAGDLGLRSLTPATPLSELNDGRGVSTVTGSELEVFRKDGSSFAVDLSGASTIQDVIDAINTADAGGGVVASFATTGNGIVLTDSTGGAGNLRVQSVNFSTAAADLGLDEPSTTATLSGRDVNGIESPGAFGNIQRLRDALLANDQQAITQAAEGLQGDYDRIVRVRGQSGARIQELEARQNRLEDENVATKALLSDLRDTDFTEAISRFSTLQNALQASLQTSAQVMNLSLLDFLG